MKKQTLQDIDVKGKRVIVRVDFNVPLDSNGNIIDDARITKTLPTIRYLIEQNAKVILMSHLGRPKGKPEAKYSLKPVVEHLSRLLNQRVELQPDCIGPAIETRARSLKNGEILLLENLRFHVEEEKNDPHFAKQLAALAEVYVNDAFGTAHRAHASTEGVAHYLPAVAGFLLAKEIEYFDKALENPKRPFVTILGGAKVSDKIKVIENLLTKVDHLLIGGAMAYTFLKAGGHQIGASKVEAEGIETAKIVIAKAKQQNVEILLPVDHVITQEINEQARIQICEGDIPAGWLGVDVGPKTIEIFCNVLKKSNTVIWNGPLGIFEMKPFELGTWKVAECLTQIKATTIIGGGDTAAAVAKFNLEDKMSHVSTGGGASLEYLEGRSLPGIQILKEKKTMGTTRA
ncbi:MAG: phosphoglycerate kinase [Candidatus Omnitrophica bacterium]|nr:phosphoglycerate kinase [Candidatus Omnitrophota bacterium]